MAHSLRRANLALLLIAFVGVGCSSDERGVNLGPGTTVTLEELAGATTSIDSPQEPSSTDAVTMTSVTEVEDSGPAGLDMEAALLELDDLPVDWMIAERADASEMSECNRAFIGEAEDSPDRIGVRFQETPLGGFVAHVITPFDSTDTASAYLSARKNDYAACSTFSPAVLDDRGDESLTLKARGEGIFPIQPEAMWVRVGTNVSFISYVGLPPSAEDFVSDLTNGTIDRLTPNGS